jgi:hypothetical protein
VESLDWGKFRAFVYGKYAKTTAPKVMCYAKRYSYILASGKVQEIETFPSTIRPEVIKSLIIVSKYIGVYEAFKAALKSYGIKLARPDAFSCFSRIYSNRNSDLWDWYAQIDPILKPEEKLLLKYIRLSGLRKEEGIISFNLIIELSKQNNLGVYLNDDGLLEHFRFKKQFLRGTKNVYISIVPPKLISEIAQSSPVAYNPIFKRLYRRKMRCRINELRDAYGTFMVRNGLIKEEVDLLQGRIPPSIFIRHYWSPSFKELRDRTLEALGQMNKQITV